MTWTTKEKEAIAALAYRNYQERERGNLIGTSDEDWALAEAEFIKMQECGNKDICSKYTDMKKKGIPV